jgi:hypothetical protein
LPAPRSCSDTGTPKAFPVPLTVAGGYGVLWLHTPQASDAAGRAVQRSESVANGPRPHSNR